MLFNTVNRGQLQLSLNQNKKGIGIPKDELFEVFDPFTVSSKTKTPTSGKTRGLTVSKQAIEAHSHIVISFTPLLVIVTGIVSSALFIIVSPIYVFFGTDLVQIVCIIQDIKSLRLLLCIQIFSNNSASFSIISISFREGVKGTYIIYAINKEILSFYTPTCISIINTSQFLESSVVVQLSQKKQNVNEKQVDKRVDIKSFKKCTLKDEMLICLTTKRQKGSENYVISAELFCFVSNKTAIFYTLKKLAVLNTSNIQFYGVFDTQKEARKSQKLRLI